MVEPVDEPPLRGSTSWAKKIFSLRKVSQSEYPPESKSSQDPTSHHAGDTDSVRGRATISDKHSSDLPDTESQGTSVVDTQGDGARPPAIESEEEEHTPKAPMHKRAIRDVRRIITASWTNWLLIFVPVAIIMGAVQDWGGIHIVSPSVIFTLNAIAIIPLASLLAYATESVAAQMGDSWGALLNVTFGNAVEIIVFVLALKAGEVRIVQSAAIGSVLSNLLLILGMSFVLGGLRFREQLFNSGVAQMSSGVMILSVISLLSPTASHAALANGDQANETVLKVSRGTSVILLLVYGLYLLFQLKSHAYFYASTPQHVIDEEAHPGVLADMLNSSSSSSSESSSTDSDSTAGSSKTKDIIKKAFRRRRRKSSSSTKEEASASFSRSDTTSGTLVGSTRNLNDDIFSGDEADAEGGIRDRQPSMQIQTRDFENENSSQRSKKRSKKSKTLGSKNKKREKEPEAMEMQETPSEKLVPAIQVGFAEQVTEIPDDNLPRRHHNHARNLSSAIIKPVLNSQNFPHHEALTRSLAPPSLRPHDRTISSGSVRRASSMPDINRHQSPAGRPSSPRPASDATTPDIESQIIETVEAVPHLSRTSAIIMLLVTTGLVALCAEFLVGSINYLVSSSGVSQTFIGLIILPLVGNAAEHVTAVTVAYKNKMDLAVNIALGSSIQIALFITPLMVMLGWAIGVEMSLYFSLFETMAIFAAAFIAGYFCIDGRSNWMEGTLLIAVYVIISINTYFIPNCGLSDTNGLTGNSTSC